jgi:hypothetical protein
MIHLYAAQLYALALVRERYLCVTVPSSCWTLSTLVVYSLYEGMDSLYCLYNTFFCFLVRVL